jgi:hypothetical protein
MNVAKFAIKCCLYIIFGCIIILWWREFFSRQDSEITWFEHKRAVVVAKNDFLGFPQFGSPFLRSQHFHLRSSKERDGAQT